MINVYFDVDGSLITPQYEYNVDKNKFTAIVDDAKTKGIVFNLNSNRSIDKLLQIREELNFNGKIIYENGIGVCNSNNNREVIIKLQKFNKKLFKNTMSKCGYKVIFCNTKNIVNKRNKKIIYCEQTREYTLTAYPRLNNEPFELDKITKLLKKIYESSYTIKRNNVYSGIIMTPKNSNKGFGLKSEDSIVASFGDEDADISMFTYSQIVGCPSNAAECVKEEVTKRGGYIAKNAYTAGAQEFIEYLMTQVKK